MSSPPRRPGFRLPWSGSDRPADTADGARPDVTDEATAPSPAEAPQAAPEGEVPQKDEAAVEQEAAAPPEQAAGPEMAREPETEPQAEAEPQEGEAAKAPESEAPRDLLRELVTAMRGVAEQARDDDLRHLRPHLDERLARFREEAEEQAAELRDRAEAEVAAIGEWAKAEAERIKAESEARVAARRKELEEQLSTNERRATEGSEEVRRRVAEYERGLAEFFTRLGSITDPADFAAAAKAMPRPPEIDEVSGTAEDNPGESPTPSPSADAGNDTAGGTIGTSASTVVVKGLTSFGSITAFKQSLEAIDGVSGVTLSLGPTGEFVYRAVHSDGFDLQGAIAAMERGSAAVERQPDGTLQVTAGRGR